MSVACLPVCRMLVGARLWFVRQAVAGWSWAVVGRVWGSGPLLHTHTRTAIKLTAHLPTPHLALPQVPTRTTRSAPGWQTC